MYPTIQRIAFIPIVMLKINHIHIVFVAHMRAHMQRKKNHLKFSNELQLISLAVYNIECFSQFLSSMFLVILYNSGA